MTANELMGILERNGWRRKKSKGGHLQYIHPDQPEKGKITLPYHGGDLLEKTLKNLSVNNLLALRPRCPRFLMLEICQNIPALKKRGRLA